MNWNADKMIKCLLTTNMADDELRMQCLKTEVSLDDTVITAKKKKDATMMNKIITMADGDGVEKAGSGSYQGRHFGK